MLRRTILLVILLVVAGKYGLDYLLSPEFQAYGDRHKAQWTCQVNNTFGGFFEIGSEYERALDLYGKVLTRCPETSYAEYAMFHKAVCLDSMTHMSDALAAYQAYLEAYPEGIKRPSALRAADRIRLAR